MENIIQLRSKAIERYFQLTAELDALATRVEQFTDNGYNSTASKLSRKVEAKRKLRQLYKRKIKDFNNNDPKSRVTIVISDSTKGFKQYNNFYEGSDEKGILQVQGD